MYHLCHCCFAPVSSLYASAEDLHCYHETYGQTAECDVQALRLHTSRSIRCSCDCSCDMHSNFVFHCSSVPASCSSCASAQDMHCCLGHSSRSLLLVMRVSCASTFDLAATVGVTTASLPLDTRVFSLYATAEDLHCCLADAGRQLVVRHKLSIYIPVGLSS